MSTVAVTKEQKEGQQKQSGRKQMLLLPTFQQPLAQAVGSNLMLYIYF